MTAHPSVLHVAVYPAPDVAGQWAAHCLDFDVVTQGNSREHVLEMLAEAVQIVVRDDRARGADPCARRAPQACWDECAGTLVRIAMQV